MNDDPNPFDDTAPGAYGSSEIRHAQDALRELPDSPSVVPEAVAGMMIAQRYKLLEPIGEGGMGVVWMAEQRSPIKRTVALKLIKAGMDSRQVLARFEAERQALAMMDHPNIAYVFDGGTTDRGHPYFVMELVKGLPLTRYCDDRRMNVRERIALFAQVCSAVQHAHQKGIIHRDLKPANVIVTEHDGRPVPKVIDFGLAKALGGSSVLTDHTMHTAYGAVAGTPIYMAPEQVAINALDIDTRADIYALGVMLYELLTGTTPHDPGSLKRAAWEEIQRIIRFDEPPRPSQRISQSGTLANLAASRNTDASRLSKLVAGELDWIVMRAMEKDRRRRYETPNDLAADLNRHLNGEPVLAAPPKWSYRARKFVKKHRGPVIAGAAVAMVLAIGLAGTTTQMFRARRAERLAKQNQDQTTSDLRSVATLLGKAAEFGNMLITVPDTSSSKPDWFTCIDWGLPLNADGSPQIYGARVHKGAGLPDLNTREPATDSGTEKAIATCTSMAISAINNSKQKLAAQRDSAETEAYVADLALGQTAMAAQNWPEARARLDACPESKRGWEWKFLRKQAGIPLWRLPSDTINVAFDTEGTHGLVLFDDGGAQLWDLTVGRGVGGRFHIGRVLSSVVHLGVTYVLAAYDNGARIWDVATGKSIGPLILADEPINTAAFNSDGTRAVIVTDSTARTWDVAKGIFISGQMHTGHIESATLSPNGSVVLTASGLDSPRLWNADNGKAIGELPWIGHPTSAIFSPDGAKILAWYRSEIWERWAQLFEIASKTPLGEPFRCPAFFGFSPFSEDGQWILAIPGRNDAQIVDGKTGKAYGEPIAYRDRCASSTFSSDSSRVLLVSIAEFGMNDVVCDEDVSFWTTDGTMIGDMRTENNSGLGPCWASISPNGELIATRFNAASFVVKARDFDIAVDPLSPGDDIGLEIAAYTERAEVITPEESGTTRWPIRVSKTSDGSIQIETLNQGRFVGSKDAKVQAFAISPDNTRLVTADDSAIRFYDTTTWREVAVFGQETAVKELKFTPDGTRLIVRFADGSAQIWDPRPLAERKKMWARRAAERKPAREYLDHLLAGASAPADLKPAIRNDPNITPLRKLVALELLDMEIRKQKREAERKAASTQPTTKP